MSYSVNWLTKVISIPTTDLTLVSGTRYQLQSFAFLIEIRRLEAAFDEGLWAEDILDHSNTRLDFAGTDFAPYDEVIHGYTVQFTGAATRVDWKGSITNINDILIANGVSFIPEPIPGLVVGAGSGLTTVQNDKLMSTPTAIDNKNELLGTTDYP